MEQNEIIDTFTQAYYDEIQVARKARTAWDVKDARDAITRSNGILLAAEAFGISREQVTEKYKELEASSFSFQTLNRGGGSRRAL